MKLASSAILTFALAAPASFAQHAPAGAEHEGRAFAFEKVRDDVYHVVGTGSMVIGSNGAVIINEHDVLLVDSHITAAAAYVLLDELKTITDKPVRYVINTHYHFDHSHGNEMFGTGVEIISHEYTRARIAAGDSASGRTYDAFVGSLPDQIAQLESQLAIADAPEREALEQRLVRARRYYAATQATTPTPPTTTLSERLTLHRGGREIRLLFFGRGHTGGDVVVHLPNERLLITGDLLTEGLPFMGDSYPTEWVATLEELKALEFDTILPGHGKPYSDRRKIDYLQDYLLDLWEQSVALHREGVSAEDAAQRIDLTAHASHFPQIEAAGVIPLVTLRIWDLLNGDAKH